MKPEIFREILGCLKAALDRLETGSEIDRDGENAARVTATSNRLRWAIKSLEIYFSHPTPPSIPARLSDEQTINSPRAEVERVQGALHASYNLKKDVVLRDALAIVEGWLKDTK